MIGIQLPVVLVTSPSTLAPNGVQMDIRTSLIQGTETASVVCSCLGYTQAGPRPGHLHERKYAKREQVAGTRRDSGRRNPKFPPNCKFLPLPQGAPGSQPRGQTHRFSLCSCYHSPPTSQSFSWAFSWLQLLDKLSRIFL